MRLSDFNYELPNKLIAQTPLWERDKSRLMVLDRGKKGISNRIFSEITEYFNPGDCLVLNDTRVIPARLYAKRKTGGKVEIFLLDTNPKSLRALIRPSKKIKNGERVELENGFYADILGEADVGRFVEFNAPIEKILQGGHVPLPPYIERDDTPQDADYYQTVYSKSPGATASPTAGLHFTRGLLEELRSCKVEIVYVTLHTSYGSFAPVKEAHIENHKMHSEYFDISEEAAGTINKVKASGKKVFAVGTTSARVLETAADEEGKVFPKKGETGLFIYPGYRYKIVDGLITNFHLPGSTLLLLVCAFAGKDLVLEAYKKAIVSGFRFYSYGDAMLIL